MGMWPASALNRVSLTLANHLESVFGAPVLGAYAMTEASHQMASNPLPRHGQRKVGFVGKLTGLEVGILDKSGVPQPQGTRAEVCIRGLNFAKGYRNNPEAIKTAFQFGWFDISHIDYLNVRNIIFS
ncbi:hypothetical protein SUGI_0362810 [Cryptomeria japonica]|nr:hypothetical protein SUGI_0362810 [Cryptomeria japonica]